jgi:hypothetical protein
VLVFGPPTTFITKESSTIHTLFILQFFGKIHITQKL